jgi:hypothetical protein
MTSTFEELKAGMRPESITAVNPGPAEYAAAGRMAGEKGAARLAQYIRSKRKVPSDAALMTYYSAAILASCDAMRAAGATEANLAIWTEAFVKALRMGFGAGRAVNGG